MPRYCSRPYTWLPPDHWREAAAPARCQVTHRFEVVARAATGRTSGGEEQRHWCVCRGCGIEVGPFKTEQEAWRHIGSRHNRRRLSAASGASPALPTGHGAGR